MAKNPPTPVSETLWSPRAVQAELGSWPLSGVTIKGMGREHMWNGSIPCKPAYHLL